MVGIGFRKDFSEEFLNSSTIKADFIEVAPENWMGIGGYWKKELQRAKEKYPIFTHGLSLSVGSPEKIDFKFLKEIKKFLKDFDIQVYSEHLSYSKCDNAHLYELLPIPFTKDAINQVVNNIKEVQDYLEQTLTLEIVSYYTPVAPELSEVDFINEIVEKSNCNLLLDVNNVYVNAFNHKYNAENFIRQMPLDKVKYIHMAGHHKVSETLIIDTHGAAIIDPVYKLFDYTMKLLKRDVPVLLERDFNIPELEELSKEIETIREIKNKHIQIKNPSNPNQKIHLKS